MPAASASSLAKAANGRTKSWRWHSKRQRDWRIGARRPPIFRLTAPVCSPRSRVAYSSSQRRARDCTSRLTRRLRLGCSSSPRSRRRWRSRRASSMKCLLPMACRCSAGATCRCAQRCWASRHVMPCRVFDRCLSVGQTAQWMTMRGSGNYISRAARWSIALKPLGFRRSTFARCPAERSCTRGFLPAVSWRISTPICATPRSSRRLPYSTSGMRPTRCRVGNSRSRSACLGTTARSTPCGAIATRWQCAPGCWTRRNSATRERGSAIPSVHVAVIPRVSITHSSCWCVRDVPRCMPR